MNENDIFFDDGEILPTFDYEGMRNKTNEEFAESYCFIESRPCMTIEQQEMQNKVLGIYNRELKRRVINRIVHPKAFEKMCEQIYQKMEEQALKNGTNRPFI